MYSYNKPILGIKNLADMSKEVLEKQRRDVKGKNRMHAKR